MKITRTELLRPGEPKSETERLWIRLRTALEYDPLTGKWKWLIRKGKLHIGERAGTLNRANNRYYVKFEQEQYAAYRLAWFYMTGAWPYEIDHINGNSLDDRWSNLRDVTHSQNCRNRGLLRENHQN